MNARRGALIVGTLVVALAVLLVVMPGGPIRTAPSQGQAAVTTPQPIDEGPAEEAARTAPQSDDEGADLVDTDEANGHSVEAHGMEPVERSFEIVTLLPKDAIPAVFNPSFVTADEGDGLMVEQEMVIGLSINGDHRAYSVPFLSGHEIVNDVVGGVPVAVTW